MQYRVKTKKRQVVYILSLLHCYAS